MGNMTMIGMIKIVFVVNNFVVRSSNIGNLHFAFCFLVIENYKLERPQFVHHIAKAWFCDNRIQINQIPELLGYRFENLAVG